MSVTMYDNQIINLSECNMLSLIVEVKAVEKRGFFEQTFIRKGNEKKPMDYDLVALPLTNGKPLKAVDIVYFGNLVGRNSAIKLCNSPGQVDNDRVAVKLTELSEEYDRVVIAAVIYDSEARKHYLNMYNELKVLLKDSYNREIVCYPLTGDYKGKSAMIFGEFLKENGIWYFKSVGEATEDRNITEIKERYRK